MTNPSKKKGSEWERRVVEFLRPLHPHADRRVSNGTKDRGDIGGVPGWVIECKNQKALDLAGWMDEAEGEAENAGVPRFAVVFPRRYHATGGGYALVPLWLLSELMMEDEK